MDFRGSRIAAARLSVLLVGLVAIPFVVWTIGDDEPEIFESIRRGQRGEVQEWIASGSDLDQASKKGKTALQVAAAWYRHDILESLLKEGAMVDKADESGFTPLMAASVKGDVQSVVKLLRHGADVAMTDNVGRTALILAAIFGSEPSFQIEDERDLKGVLNALFSAGARLDAQSGDGRTALMFAAGKGNTVAVDWLLRHGADPHVVDESGRDAMWWAREYEQQGAMTLLSQ